MLSKRIDIDSRVVFSFIILCVFQSFAFAQSDSPFYSPVLGWVYRIISFILVLFILTYGASTIKKRLDSYLFACSILMFWFLELIHSYGELNLFSIIVFLFILPFFFQRKDIQARTFFLFHRIIFWMSLFGVIITVVYIFNILPPLSMAEFYDNGEYGEAMDSYANYYIGYLEVSDYGLVRFCGLFNEPGFFGTLAALALIGDKMKLNKYNIVILLACLFTLSVACFVLIFLYYLIKLLLSGNIKLFFLLILFVSLFIFLANIEWGDANLKIFFNRFSFNGGSIIEDDRTTSQFDTIWNKILKNPDMLLLGYGQRLPKLFSSSYKIFIIKHGLLGSFLIFAPFIIACLNLANKNKDSLILILLFLISIYQRPQIFNLSYLIILIGGINYLRYQSNGYMFNKRGVIIEDHKE